MADFDAEQYEKRAAGEGYLHRTLVGLDQFVNVLTGGLPDETISARSQRAADRGNKFGKFMSWWLGKIQSQHGKKAEAGDEARAERVEDTEANALGEQPK
jgi:hypothetical protein